MFAMSVFQSVLERLKAEDTDEQDDAPEPAAYTGINGLPTGFVMAADARQFADVQSVSRLYGGFMEEIPLSPPVMPAHLGRITPEEIAHDLGITGELTPAGLHDLRRTFARDNHPDGIHPDFRSNATIRMKIANMLIDEALRQLRS